MANWVIVCYNGQPEAEKSIDDRNPYCNPYHQGWDLTQKSKTSNLKIHRFPWNAKILKSQTKKETIDIILVFVSYLVRTGVKGPTNIS